MSAEPTTADLREHAASGQDDTDGDDSVVWSAMRYYTCEVRGCHETCTSVAIDIGEDLPVRLCRHHANLIGIVARRGY